MSSGQAQPLEPEAFEEILRRQAATFGLSGASSGISKLSRYLSELDRWRRRVNLTGDLSVDELAAHALESAFAERLIIHGARVIDIGSGGGFPGLPLALIRTDISMTLLEPRARRAAFLRHCSRVLDLSNAVVLEARIEEVGGQTFDVGTVRAVGHLTDLIGPGGFLVARGVILAWTTEPADLPGFERQRLAAIPGSARRVIAEYRKES